MTTQSFGQKLIKISVIMSYRDFKPDLGAFFPLANV